MGGILIPRTRPTKTAGYLQGDDVYSYSVYEKFSEHRDSLRGKENHSSHRPSVTSEQVRHCGAFTCGDPIITSLFVVVSVDVTVNSMRVFSVAVEIQQHVSLHCCGLTKCFVLLLTIMSMYLVL